MRVLCFGNEFVKEDSLAKELADELKIAGVEFVKCDSLEGISGDVVILDVAEGIDEVQLISLDKVQDIHPVSMHDFDLGTELKLRKEIGEIKDVKIIGIPMKGDKEKIKEEIKKHINNLITS